SSRPSTVGSQRAVSTWATGRRLASVHSYPPLGASESVARGAALPPPNQRSGLRLLSPPQPASIRQAASGQNTRFIVCPSPSCVCVLIGHRPRARKGWRGAAAAKGQQL